MKLSEPEKTKIRELAAHVEARTGVQVLTVVAGKSDTYPEIPWKAFALGAALAALGVAAAAFLKPGWNLSPPLLPGIAILGTGMLLAAACIFLQPFARVFLAGERSAEETRQHAQTLFLERNLSRTPMRRAVLILVSLFERRTSIVADTGIVDRVTQAEIENIAASMEAALGGGRASAALTSGLPALEALLLRYGFASPGDKDDIEEELVETEGPNS
jgi:putative membrane protein